MSLSCFCMIWINHNSGYMISVIAVNSKPPGNKLEKVWCNEKMSIGIQWGPRRISRIWGDRTNLMFVKLGWLLKMWYAVSIARRKGDTYTLVTLIWLTTSYFSSACPIPAAERTESLNIFQLLVSSPNSCIALFDCDMACLMKISLDWANTETESSSIEYKAASFKNLASDCWASKMI